MKRKSTLGENIWKGIGFALGAAVVSAGLTAIAFAVQSAWQKSKERRALDATTTTGATYP